MNSRDREYIHVRIGEIKFGKKGAVLQATLGSCLGIAIIDRVNKRCGLAHCFLPAGEGKSPEAQPGKYVVDAIPYLLTKLNLESRLQDDFEIYLAGGGNMMAQLKQRNVDHIGKLNKAKALEILQEKKLTIRKILDGEELATKIIIDCDTLEIKMIRINDKSEQKK
ncbi:chemotaxis protein CheD [Halobacteriovorax sp. RZ-2]|uniref:chemotaxis protein CheD n=1 Tax=unclassified Halobacteriovorax TaxID=2639665 RepID=UPI003722C898